MIARLTVQRGTLTEYPLAEKVRGGWQNGVTFYPDAEVKKVTALRLLPAEPSVDDLIASRAGLAIATAAWQEGASAMLRSVNQHDDGSPGHRKPWVKPVSPYGASLLAYVRADDDDMTVDTDPSADGYRDVIGFVRENAAELGMVRPHLREQVES